MPDRPATREEAIEVLAETLHRKMEHIDPSPEGSKWSAMSELDRDFYRSCVEAVLLEEEMVRAVVASHASLTTT